MAERVSSLSSLLTSRSGVALGIYRKPEGDRSKQTLKGPGLHVLNTVGLA